MSSVKQEEQQVNAEQRQDNSHASLPKANPYLLQEFKTRVEKLLEAEQEVKYQRHLESLPPEQRKVEREKKQHQQEQGVQASKSSATPDENEKTEIQKTWGGRALSWVDTFVMGVEPKKLVDATSGAAGVVKDVALAAKEKADDLAYKYAGVDNVMPISFTRIDPDQHRGLRNAETKLHVEKYRMRKLLEQVEESLNPFSNHGSEIGEFGHYEKKQHYDSRSAQEAMSIMATVLAVTSELSHRSGDSELAINNQKLDAIFAAAGAMSRTDLESAGYTMENMSEQQMAQKWGLLRNGNGVVPGMGKMQNGLPEMFFEVQQLITAYNVMQNLTGVEKELESALKEVDLNQNLNQAEKHEERKKAWNELLNYRITGSVKEGDQADGAKTKVIEHLYGAAILAPLLLAEEGGISLSQATAFRLLAEKANRAAGREDENSYRILDAYSYAEKSDKIRDLVASNFGKKASELSDSELDQALSKTKEEFGQDYYKAEKLYEEIGRSLPAFIELNRALEKIQRGAEPPISIDTATSNRADYENLFKDLREARQEVGRIISERLKLTPEQAIQMADEFVARNQGNLSPEAMQIPQRIKMIAEKTFGYTK